jgi:predicted ArsR family transcriptional regulator
MTVDDSGGALAALAPTRRAILEAIKRAGGVRAEELAEELQITVSGVRQHLAALQSEGFVEHRTVRGQPGRPKFVFYLTENGEQLFPKHYDRFALQLIEFIEGEDPALLLRAIRAQERDRLARILPRVEGKPLKERVAELAAFYDEEGFLAEWTELPDGKFQLTEHNCPVLEIARATPQVCGSEARLLKAALDADVELVHHMINGEPACVYNIRPAS